MSCSKFDQAVEESRSPTASDWMAMTSDPRKFSELDLLTYLPLLPLIPWKLPYIVDILGSGQRRNLENFSS